ncbi:MAG: peptide deformylase [Pyrinomonadaceae bacterium]|nr:peptide deformylase [Pyrinomonadaceae bacterium]
MALLKVINYPEPVLLKVGEPVTVFDDELKKLVADMFETMYNAEGVGIAAPQVNISKRLFVMDVSFGEDEKQKIVAINPEIIHVEGEQIGDEGCLSFPEIFAKIKRNQRAIMRAQNENGEPFELDGIDLTARCALHETDHCDGIVFIDRMTPLKRELAKRKIRKLKRTGVWD